ncbi:MAG: hypothetical protein A2X13_05975 [Bacteroidetes bacterium GWC2_33_15]|nr:MAG: hypothetical protein A2X10_03785 [Bacteroidetes bacterium GWA2_33_15]OFX51772.1 MAG: hypothetical protein A2X13_05975 [Bacteroidetes bacterium GWC2_33_15]OFX66856.1 MAG: hypothetical protein A2X15_09150 [Bacteroidetes bacterium GWB2_32_14]OFX67114.1 MAG: hypothetical protein A2X14_10655 [Bacteroidetes bacterium GWD2_33_33]HAN17206.1 hypothetical protein [Bacteroidales bacterium]
MDYNNEQDYWLEKLSDTTERCSFPYNYLTSNIKKELLSFNIDLPADVTNKLLQISGDSDFRLFILLKAGLFLLLNKYTGKKNIIIGSPIMKQETDTNFINTYLPVKLYLDENHSFIEYLNNVKNELILAIDNQNFPIDTIPEYLGLSNQIKNQTFFDIAVLLEELQDKKYIEHLKLDMIFRFSKKNEGINLTVDYNGNLYKKQTIERIISHLSILLGNALENKNSLIGAIEWYKPEEKEKVLYHFNQTDKNYNLDNTVLDIFKQACNINPDQIIVSCDDKSLSYRMLDFMSDQFAGYLQSKGVIKGDLVIIKEKPSIDFIVKLLGIVKSGGVYIPVDTQAPNERLKSIIIDCRARYFVTDESNSEISELLEENDVNIINCIGSMLEFEFKPVSITSEDIIYIIYTSGSTGKPKGVKISHRGISNMCFSYVDIFKTNFKSTASVVSNPAFDAMAFELWPNLTNGVKTCVAPENIIHDIKILVNWINTKNITTLYLPTSVAEIIMNYKTTMPSVQTLATAGDVLKEYPGNNINYEVYNLYGPTEDSVWTTIYKVPKDNIENQFPLIGKPLFNKKIFIVNNDCQLLPCGIPGEMWIGGAGIAKGYVGNNNEEKFIETPFSSTGIVYKTGDLACWHDDGNIEFIGRKDNQTKIRGFRIELDEIRVWLLKYPEINEAVVIIKEVGHEKYLCSYYTSLKNIDLDELKTHLKKYLPYYMIPNYFIKVDKFNLNRSGKIDKNVLPAPSNILIDIVKPQNDNEQKLFDIWAELLGTNDFGIDHNFFEIGGHSLRAINLISLIEDKFMVKFQFRKIFEFPTIREQAKFIETIDTEKQHEILPVEKKQFYPVSSSQNRLFLLHQMEPTAVAYNVLNYIELTDKVDVNVLKNVFNIIVDRHEAFRTSFSIIDGLLYQRIQDNVNFEIEKYLVKNGHENEMTKKFTRPFDLEKAPLFRIGYFETEKNHQFLLIDMHHIICDAVTQKNIEVEIKEIIQEKTLKPLRIQYKDYSLWQNSEGYQKKVEKQKLFWKNNFKGELPKVNLPIDFPRPKFNSFDGAVVSFTLSHEETQIIRSLTEKYKSTMFMTILGVYNIFLSKLSGDNQIIVGTPIAGRNHKDLGNISGMFINTLAIKSDIYLDTKIGEFFLATKENVINVFENQEYQFDDLVGELSLSRDTSRNPVFDVMFNMLNHLDYKDDEPDFETEQSLNHDQRPSKFDLNLTAIDYGNTVYFNFVYATLLFKPESIDRFIIFFKQIINQLNGSDDKKISDIDIVVESEKRKILDEFNNTKSDYPNLTIPQLFYEQVKISKNKIAVVDSDNSITFSELDKKSNQIANMLHHLGVNKGDIIAIMLPASVDLTIYIWGIIKSGGVFLPIDIDTPVNRLDYILSDSNAKFLVSDYQYTSNLTGTNIINVNDSNYNEYESSDIYPNITNSDILYVIYTSGTTGQPKGIKITHKNLSNYYHWVSQKTEVSNNDHILINNVFSFDLVYTQFFSALLGGAKLFLINKNEYLSGDYFTRYTEKQLITCLKMTPSLFSAIIHSKEFNNKTFYSVRSVILGGEALKIEDVKYVYNMYPDIQFIDEYGPTETTIGSVAKIIDFNDYQHIKTSTIIGKPIFNTQVYVLNVNGIKLQPFGIPGELCIGGEGVSKGYINNQELTKSKFIDNPFILGETIYRTGDLVRYLPNGNLEYIGRIDNQVKIRGYRIELHEVEKVILSHEHIKDCIVSVFNANQNNDNILCAYIVYKNRGTRLTDNEIKEYLSLYLPNYMVPVLFIEIDKKPLTLNGKVDKNALPIPDINTEMDFVAPINQIEKKLAEIWADVLAISKNQIGCKQDFFRLGGQSFKASQLTYTISKVFNVKFNLRDIFFHPTIEAQAKLISEAAPILSLNIIAPAKIKEFYDLAPAQNRMFFLQQINPKSTVYNLQYTIKLDEKFAIHSIEEVFKQLVSRHESLRTSFQLINGVPKQIIHNSVDFNIESIDLRNNAGYPVMKPFDLSKTPLFRLYYITDLSGELNLLVDSHHIISDEVSQKILFEEFHEIIANKVLNPVTIQYKDYSEWLKQPDQEIIVREQEKYWLGKLSGDLPRLNLPTDYSRPEIQNFEGASTNFLLNNNELSIINQLSKSLGLTPYMSLLGIYSILLSKLSGSEDMIIGTPFANRNDLHLQKIVGLLLNTIVLRIQPSGDKILLDYFSEIKKNVIEDLENQGYPFSDLVNKLSFQRDASRNPIFDVMFNYVDNSDVVINNENSQNIKYNDIRSLENTNLVSLIDMNESEFIHVSGVAKIDISLTAIEFNNSLMCSIEYCTKLFKKETINRFIKYFRRVINQIGENPSRKINSIELIDPAEKTKLLSIFNDTNEAYSKNKRIIDIFEEQVKKTPDKVALISSNNFLTYKQVNSFSNQIARKIQERGIKHENIVGVYLDRSVEMIISILGILKSGAGYLPISTSDPIERVNYYIGDSKIDVLITDRENEIQEIKASVLLINDKSIREYDDSNVENNSNSNSLAYVIYTSGSTGNPKGVVIENHSVINRIEWMKRTLDFTAKDIFLQKTTFTFDVSVWEIFGWFFAGASLHVIQPNHEKDPKALILYIEKNKITIIHFVPSMLEAFITYLESLNNFNTNSLKCICTSGEELKPDQVSRLGKILSDSNKIKLINLYGPTEATVDVTYFQCQFNEFYHNVPIGKPISNTQIYILDYSRQQLQPIGVAGELCIGGVNLARGYIGKTQLTKEKFIDNPFFPSEKIYCTGDIARWLPDGNIEFLGRIDNQVKIRGFRIELSEIENCLLQHEAIKECVVVAREKQNEKYLCAYVRIAGNKLEIDFKSLLTDKLPAYMIPSHFMVLDNFPLTSSGKIDRKALPEPEIEFTRDYVAPENEIDVKLANIWADILGLRQSEISTNANFFELGGHSLKAIELSSKIRKQFKIEIEIATILKKPILTQLSREIQNMENNRLVSIRPIEKKEYYPLSSAQHRMYLMHCIKPESVIYNISQTYLIEGEVNINVMNAALDKIIQKHECLRISFNIINDIPVQRINYKLIKKVQYIEYFENDINDFIQGLIKPFDFKEPSLFRIYLIKRDLNKYIVFFDIHHIIADGISLKKLSEEFLKLIAGQEITKSYVQYKDFVFWQKAQRETDRYQKQKQYWNGLLQNKPIKLNLPYDLQKVASPQNLSAINTFECNVELSDKIKETIKRLNITPYQFFLSVFNILLSNICDQEEVLVGTAMAGRNHSDLDEVIGMFVNMLLVVNSVSQNRHVDEFILEVKENLIDAIENQDYQYEDLVNDLSITEERGVHSLFNVSYAYNSFESQYFNNGDLKISKYDFINLTSDSKYELSLYGTRIHEKYVFQIHYRIDLFNENTIRFLSEYFKDILLHITENSSMRVGDIPCLLNKINKSSDTNIEPGDSFNFSSN